MARTRSIRWHGGDLTDRDRASRTVTRGSATLRELFASDPLKKLAALANLGVLFVVVATFAPKAAGATNNIASMPFIPPNYMLLALLGSSAIASVLLLANRGVHESATAPEGTYQSETPAGPGAPTHLIVPAQTASEPDDHIDGMVARMGHDLRTPLNAIIGFSDMMQQQLHGPLGSDRYHAYAEHIRESGKSLLTAIESTLAVTQTLAKKNADPARIKIST